MKKSDARLIEMGVPSKFLMQTAGEAICSNAALKHPVAIVCGSGNNAGDGYAAAAHLKDMGEDPTVFILSDKFSEDGKYFYDKCKEKNVKIHVWTVNDTEHIRQMINVGVDAVITNYPDRGVQVRDEM